MRQLLHHRCLATMVDKTYCCKSPILTSRRDKPSVATESLHTLYQCLMVPSRRAWQRTLSSFVHVPFFRETQRANGLEPSVNCRCEPLVQDRQHPSFAREEHYEVERERRLGMSRLMFRTWFPRLLRQCGFCGGVCVCVRAGPGEPSRSRVVGQMLG